MITRCRVATGQKEGLTALIKHLNEHTVMAEIGCYAGESTVMFAENVKLIYAIDPWLNLYDKNDKSSSIFPMKEVEKSFDERIKNFSNVKKIKTTSIEGSKLFTDKVLDFVYIDANHQYNAVLEDIKIWIVKVKDKGLIGGHDYTSKPVRFRQVIKAVKDIFKKEPDFIFEDTSWLVKL